MLEIIIPKRNPGVMKSMVLRANLSKVTVVLTPQRGIPDIRHPRIDRRGNERNSSSSGAQKCAIFESPAPREPQESTVDVAYFFAPHHLQLQALVELLALVLIPLHLLLGLPHLLLEDVQERTLGYRRRHFALCACTKRFLLGLVANERIALAKVDVNATNDGRQLGEPVDAKMAVGTHARGHLSTLPVSFVYGLNWARARRPSLAGTRSCRRLIGCW